MMQKRHVVAGKFGKPYGLKGWLKLHSTMAKAANIFDYPWFINSKDGKIISLSSVDKRINGGDLFVHIPGYDTPEAAKTLTNIEILIERKLLPKTDINEYYWADLEGLEVLDTNGYVFGKVSHLMEAGACDVLVVKGTKERLIPFDLINVVKKVDMEQNQIIVEWDRDF